MHVARLAALWTLVLLWALLACAQAGTVWFASTPGVSQAQPAPPLSSSDPTSALSTINPIAWGPAVACTPLSSWPWLTDTAAPYATWILETDAPEGDSWRWIRHFVTLPEGTHDFSGSIVWTADNAAEVYINRVPIGSDGQPFGTPNDHEEWRNIKTFPVEGSLLHAGQNEMLFLVRNYWGPGGLIFEGGLSAEGFPEGFPDIPLDYWAYDEIIACLTGGVVEGYPDGLYHPDDVVRRSQMAVFIARALAGGDDYVPSGPAEATFSDVPDTGLGVDGTQPYWAYDYVEYCAAHDIVQGYWDGSYHPEEVVNRGQMAVYVARAVAGGDDAVPEDTDGATFTDVTETNDWAWCYRYVEYCAANGIVQGYWDGTYRPAQAVTRDQMAVYIQRAFQLPM